MKLTEEEMIRNSKLYKERGEIVYEQLQDYIKHNDEIVRDTPLMSYVHVGFKFILDGYMTQMDIDPHKSIDYEMDNLAENFSILISKLKAYHEQLNR